MYERRSWASEPILIRIGALSIQFRLVVTFKDWVADSNIVEEESSAVEEDVSFQQGVYYNPYEVAGLLVDQHHNGQNHRYFYLGIGDGCDVDDIDYDSQMKDDKLIFCIVDARVGKNYAH